LLRKQRKTLGVHFLPHPVHPSSAVKVPRFVTLDICQKRDWGTRQ